MSFSKKKTGRKPDLVGRDRLLNVITQRRVFANRFFLQEISSGCAA
jgi:hypothetical protein